jgi:hypothetical protein
MRADAKGATIRRAGTRFVEYLSMAQWFFGLGIGPAGKIGA